MFRNMRRSRQQLDHAETVKILQSGTTGVLGLTGDGGYPYAVPINYVYEDGKIYFHGAKSGHKYDSIKTGQGFLMCDRKRGHYKRGAYHIFSQRDPVRACQDPGDRRGNPPCRQGLQPPIQRRPGSCGAGDPERMERFMLCGDLH